MSTEKIRSGYSRSHRAVEITSIALVVGMLLMMAIRVGREIESTGDWIYLGFTALTGYLTADFLSGVVHWAGDTLGDETTPIIGKNFVMPFRQHHVDPKEIASNLKQVGLELIEDLNGPRMSERYGRTGVNALQPLDSMHIVLARV